MSFEVHSGFRGTAGITSISLVAMASKLPRKWLHGASNSLSRTIAAAPGALRLRVLQFNLLANGFAQGGSFAFFGDSAKETSESRDLSSDALYPMRMLDWDYRLPLILEEILQPDEPADFVALAELNHQEEVHEALKPEYEMYFAPKPKSAQESQGYPADGVGLFWRTSRWTAEDIGSLVFDQGKANQVLVYGIFSERDTGKKIAVAASHFKAKPGEANDATRLRQAEQTIARLHELVGTKNMPVIFMGDLNTTPESSALRLLSSRFEPAVPFWEDHNWTTWKSRTSADGILTIKRTIDYVLLSDSNRIRGGSEATGKWTVLDRWVPFSDAEVGPRGLPSDRYPSDHIAGCFDLEFTF